MNVSRSNWSKIEIGQILCWKKETEKQVILQSNNKPLQNHLKFCIFDHFHQCLAGNSKVESDSLRHPPYFRLLSTFFCTSVCNINSWCLFVMSKIFLQQSQLCGYWIHISSSFFYFCRQETASKQTKKIPEKGLTKLCCVVLYSLQKNTGYQAQHHGMLCWHMHNSLHLLWIHNSSHDELHHFDSILKNHRNYSI